MPRLALESDVYGIMDLGSVSSNGNGVEALSGVTGLGLPPVELQWNVGAGDGSTYRGRRVSNRVIDIPLFITEANRENLKETISRLSLMLSQPCVLRFIEDDGSSWYTTVHRSGGGSWTYGDDTVGLGDLLTIITVEAGDPYFTSSEQRTQIIRASSGRGLLGDGASLVNLKLTASQTIGSVTLSNPGDAPAYPVWEIHGPGTDVQVINGIQSWKWNGVLAAGEVLTVNTQTSAVRDGNNVNRYGDMAPAPRLWAIPPGDTVAQVTMAGSSQESYIKVSWRPRKWAVV